MTKPLSELLRTAAERSLPVIRAIPDERLADPTPCGEYDVRALLGHLHQVVVNFQLLAAKKDVDFSVEAEDVCRRADWRDSFAVETAALVDAWAEPGAEEGTAGAMGLPAAVVGRMVLGDLVIHAWDLALATGQEYAPDPAVVDDVLGTFRELAPTGRTMGAFGPEHPLPDAGAGASPWERLLALTGRDPSWTRPE
ncbi:TIGR03086 family metal-binding protein [Streptomyces thermolilacinus]|uniref:TIGR03086 family protein n=1 Tax=Streptomyces thermolilacinus SPC6 TaxID=1306406 RepID=A0A1D3DZ96_9ACTN|nr:TIGR03086 family metal-binding protein [Streptomyces thermolilacinus]OEJ97651.1 TIGR03086 family protein [Streptomyces thermolilacinus SPC6]